MLSFELVVDSPSRNSGGSAYTVTASVTAAVCNVKSCTTSWPGSTSTVTESELNPVRSALSRYEPGRTLRNSYAPSPPLCRDSTTAPRSSRIAASGTAAPDSSNTRPRMTLSCPNRGFESARIHSDATRQSRESVDCHLVVVNLVRLAAVRSAHDPEVGRRAPVNDPISQRFERSAGPLRRQVVPLDRSRSLG